MLDRPEKSQVVKASRADRGGSKPSPGLKTAASGHGAAEVGPGQFRKQILETEAGAWDIFLDKDAVKIPLKIRSLARKKSGRPFKSFGINGQSEPGSVHETAPIEQGLEFFRKEKCGDIISGI